MRKESKEKLVEKNIKWKEEYTDKTQFLKDQFEDVVGPGSYFRFEGLAPNGDGYYCIIGPAKVHAPRAKFFAGVRKLPATYSAGGKYFDSLDSAASYAKETWGVPTPSNLKPYTSRQLFGISKKVHEWKANKEKKEEREKEKESFTIHEIIREAHANDRLIREGMPVPKKDRTGYHWHTYEAIVGGHVANFNQLKEENPSFLGALNEIKAEKRQRYCLYERKYGADEDLMRKMFRTYVGYSQKHGLYAIYIGPYLMAPDDQLKFYEGLGALGLYNGPFGGDLPKGTIKTLLDMPNKEVFKKTKIPKFKHLAGLHYADNVGRFDVFQKAYRIPSVVTGNKVMEKGIPRHGLEEFQMIDEDGNSVYGEHTNEEQIEHMERTGKPLVQRFGFDDYSQLFDYNSEFLNHKGESRDWFRRKSLGPHGRPRGIILPPNHFVGQKTERSPEELAENMPEHLTEAEVDNFCQIYSLSNYEEAQTNNMVISSGTRPFINRDGIKKAYVNIIGLMSDEDNKAMLEHVKEKIGGHSNYKHYIEGITKDISSFLYFITGVGRLDEGTIESIETWQMKGRANTPKVGPTTINGVLNLDDHRGSWVPNPKSGPAIFTKLLNIVSKFYEGALRKRIADAKENGDGLAEKEASDLLLKISPLLSLRLKSNAFLPSSVQRINEGMRISSETKNETRLLSEIAHFMASRDMDEVNDGNVEEVVKFLNSGGDDTLRWTNTYNRESRQRGKDDQGQGKKYFNAGNTKPLMVKVLGDLVMQKVYEVMMAETILVVNEPNAVEVSSYLNQNGFEACFGPSTVKRMMNKMLKTIATKKIYDFVVENNIKDSGEASVQAVSNFLAENGFEDSFSKSKIQYIMRKSLNLIDQGKELDQGFFNKELTIQGIAEQTDYKEKMISKIYLIERHNQNKVGKAEKKIHRFIVKNNIEIVNEGVVDAISRNLESIGLGEVLDHGEIDRVMRKFLNLPIEGEDEIEEEDETLEANIIWDEERQKFISYDIHESFQEVFEYIRNITEISSYDFMDKSEKEFDPKSGAMLIPTNELGIPEIIRVPTIFKNPPVEDMESYELEEIFKQRTEEERIKARTIRSDDEMYQLFDGKYGPEEMDEISARDYQHQIGVEFDEDDLNLVADDELPEDDFDPDIQNDDGDGDGEVDNPDDVMIIDNEVEEVENPDALREQAPQEEEKVPEMIKNLLDDDDDDDFDFGDDDDDDDVFGSSNAIKNIIKLSQELDNEGKSKESLELLRLAQKFSKNFRKGK